MPHFSTVSFPCREPQYFGDKAECRCTTMNHRLSICTKIVSIIQTFDGKVVCTNCHFKAWQKTGEKTKNRDGIPNSVTLTFDLLTSASMHVERLLYSIRVQSLVSIAQAVFLLERGQTDRQTQMNAIPTPAAMQPAWVVTWPSWLLPLQLPATTLTRSRASTRKFIWQMRIGMIEFLDPDGMDSRNERRRWILGHMLHLHRFIRTQADSRFTWRRPVH